MIRFLLDDRLVETARPAGTVVLDVVRYDEARTGTKIGCREGDCGACTVLVGELREGRLEYRSMTSCLLALASVHGKHVVTVEGLTMPGLSPVQRAMVDAHVREEVLVESLSVNRGSRDGWHNGRSSDTGR